MNTASGSPRQLVQCRRSFCEIVFEEGPTLKLCVCDSIRQEKAFIDPDATRKGVLIWKKECC